MDPLEHISQKAFLRRNNMALGMALYALRVYLVKYYSGTVPEFIEIKDESELNTLPCGLYRLPRTEWRKEYNPVWDVFVEGCFTRFGRVRPYDAPFLIGVDLEIRPDGCQIIKQWIHFPE